MIKTRDIIKSAIDGNDTPDIGVEKMNTDLNKRSIFKTGCSTGNCKRVAPKFRLSWCNFKTIMCSHLEFTFGYLLNKQTPFRKVTSIQSSKKQTP